MTRSLGLEDDVGVSSVPLDKDGGKGDEDGERHVPLRFDFLVRGELLRPGVSLAAWCREKGVGMVCERSVFLFLWFQVLFFLFRVYFKFEIDLVYVVVMFIFIS